MSEFEKSQLKKEHDSYSPFSRGFWVKSILSKVFSSIYACSIYDQINIYGYSLTCIIFLSLNYGSDKRNAAIS